MPRYALVVEHSPVWEKTTYKVPITDDAPTDADELRDWVMAKVLAGEAELFHDPEVKSSIDGMDSDYAAPTYEDEPEGVTFEERDGDLIITVPTTDNFAKGDRALLALKAYGIPNDDPSGGEFGDAFAPAYPISDLMADLLHLAQRHDTNIAYIVGQAIGHYGSDCIEQAFTADEEWPQPLQQEANVDRARAVLAACNVPEYEHDHCLRMVGLLPPNEEQS